jgi:hypothetical protein
VAVVGASNDPAKWGQWLARSALLGRLMPQSEQLVAAFQRCVHDALFD